MQIHIPTPLRPYAGKQSTIQVSAKTVAEALNALTSQFPDLRKPSEETQCASAAEHRINTPTSPGEATIRG